MRAVFSVRSVYTLRARVRPFVGLGAPVSTLDSRQVVFAALCAPSSRLSAKTMTESPIGTTYEPDN